MTSGDRRWRLGAAGIAAAFLLGPALARTPRAVGDSGEYLVMTEALFHHGSTDLRLEDEAAVDAAVRKGEIVGVFESARESYRPDRHGYARSLHFWVYPLAALPAKALLHALGANEQKALPVTNALLLLIAVVRVGLISTLAAPRRLLLAALLAVSPLVWFVSWPHPEVFSCAFLALALAARWEGQPVAAVLFGALASLQSAPLVLVAFVLLVHALRRPGDRVRAVLAFLPALVPFAASLWSFGRLSPLTASAAATDYLSAKKALELFFDLDLGLLPYVPLAVLGALVAPVLVWRSRAALVLALEAWGVLLAIAFACTATTNWNHGTVGPSRYALWMLPLVFDTFLLPLGVASLGPRLRAAVIGLAVLALLGQAGLVAARGLDPPEDYLEHSYVARFVLGHAPSLYAPSPEIFAERTRGTEGVPDEPVVYRVDGRCRKVMTQKRHWSDVLALCGAPARTPDFKTLAAASRRGEWVYVDY